MVGGATGLHQIKYPSTHRVSRAASSFGVLVVAARVGLGLRRKERLLCLVAVMTDDAMKAHLLIYTHVRYCRTEFDRWKLEESS
jgi:hypothetical protein